MEKQERKRSNPCCEKCGGKFGYYRIKENSFVCRRCGHETKIDVEAF